MASAQSKLFYSFLRLIGKKSLLKRQFATGRLNLFSSPEPPRKILEICHVHTHQINGSNVFTLTPKQKGSNKHILYLHGGAYVGGFVKVHWNFLAYLLQHLQCSITAPDYPLAPKYTYKEAFEVVATTYKSLLESVHPDNLILMGDSAGGGFALALAQKMKNETVPTPSQLILLSPWLDITLTNPEIAKIDPADPFMGIEGLRMAGMAYAGDTDPAYYLLSPIHGPLEAVGKISVFTGTKEILVADTRKLLALAKSKGIQINYYEYQDMVHVWMLLNFPESRQARDQIIELIKE